MQNDGDRDFSATPGGTRTDRPTGVGAGAPGGDYDRVMTDGAAQEDAKAKVKQAAAEAGHRAAERIEERAEVQKTRATSQLGDLARSLRTASDQLPPDNGMGRYMGVAATQVDNLAAFLDQNDVADLVDGVEDFARRQPAAFVGGAFAIGMLGARFLKSSRPAAGRDRYDDRGGGTRAAAATSRSRRRPGTALRVAGPGSKGRSSTERRESWPADTGRRTR